MLLNLLIVPEYRHGWLSHCLRFWPFGKNNYYYSLTVPVSGQILLSFLPFSTLSFYTFRRLHVIAFFDCCIQKCRFHIHFFDNQIFMICVRFIEANFKNPLTTRHSLNFIVSPSDFSYVWKPFCYLSPLHHLILKLVPTFDSSSRILILLRWLLSSGNDLAFPSFP